jgi:hypothetical protein
MKKWTECVPADSNFLAQFREEFKDEPDILALLDMEYGYREIEDAINSSLPNTEYAEDDKPALVQTLKICSLNSVIRELESSIRLEELQNVWEKIEDDVTAAVETLGD